MNSMSYLENSGKSCSRAQLLPDKHGRTVADYRGQGDWSHIDATYLKVCESWRIVVIMAVGVNRAALHAQRARRSNDHCRRPLGRGE
jgi:hypothetical protein